MRVLGVLTFLLGAAATAYAVHGAFSRRRPVDVAFALLAPVAMTAALAGALLSFVPDFF